MNYIKVDNNYSYLTTENQEVKEYLWNALRFRSKGYYHSTAYKNRSWDGFTDFYKKETGRFLTGLLFEIQALLKSKNIEYQITDNRQHLEFLSQKIDENFLGHGYTLRDYQIEYIEKIAKYKRGIIDSRTGSGKTMCFVGIVKNLPIGTKTLILCNRKSLVEQNYHDLEKFEIPNIGRVYDKYKEPNVITCSTIQSYDHIEHLLPSIDAIIVDELHLLSSGKAKKLYSKLKNCSIRIGMSATPFKFGGKDLVQKALVKGYVGSVIKLNESTDSGKLSTKELQDRNILSTVNCVFYRVQEPKLKYEIYIDAVTKGIAQNNHLNVMVKKLATSLEGRTLILVDRIEHGDRLKELMPHAYWIQGKDDINSRKFVIEQLSNNNHAIGIASTGIMSVGINVWIHNLINCCDANAEHVLIQALGRGLRVKDDKSHLCYYDFLFEINKYLDEHSKNRIKILKNEGHQVTIKDGII